MWEWKFFPPPPLHQQNGGGLYCGCFGHALLYTTKMIVSTCRRLRCLSTCQKQNSSFTSSLRYYILKNPAILLADSIWNHNWRPRILPDMGLLLISITILVSILDYFQEKPMTKFYSILGLFGPFLPKFGQKGIFLEKRDLSVFKYSSYLRSCQKPKKLICHSWGNSWTDRWMDRRTEGLTENHDFVGPSVG